VSRLRVTVAENEGPLLWENGAFIPARPYCTMEGRLISFVLRESEYAQVANDLLSILRQIAITPRGRCRRLVGDLEADISGKGAWTWRKGWRWLLCDRRAPPAPPNGVRTPIP